MNKKFIDKNGNRVTLISKHNKQTQEAAAAKTITNKLVYKSKAAGVENKSPFEVTNKTVAIAPMAEVKYNPEEIKKKFTEM